MKNCMAWLIGFTVCLSCFGSRAGELDCVSQIRKLIQDGYNDGLMELVDLDGPYSWTEGDKQKHAFVVTYCNPGDTSSKKKRKKNCQKTSKREIRVATCGGKGFSEIVDVNSDKFVDLSDLARGVRGR